MAVKNRTDPVSHVLLMAHSSFTCPRHCCLWPLPLLTILGHIAPLPAAPLDALRTLWTTRSDSWFDPTDLARQRPTTHTELALDHHVLIRSRIRESTTWGLSGRQNLPLFRGTLRLELGRAGTEARFSSDTARLSSRPNRRGYFDLSYGRSGIHRLDLGLETRLGPAPGVEGAAGLRMQLPAGWSASAYLSRYAVDHQVSFDFNSDRLDAKVPGYRSAGGLDLQGDLFHKVGVYLRGHRGHLPTDLHSEGYTLAPRADWGVYEGSLTIPLTSPFYLHSQLRSRHLSSRPDGYLQDRRFMRSRATARDLSGFFSLSYAPREDREMVWGLFVNRGEVDVTRGRLESWPFLNSFASVVGGKDWSFRGNADLHLHGADFRFRRRHPRWRLETATRLFRLRGGLSAVSRERSKFNFGDLLFPEEHRSRGTVRADVLDLDVRIEHRFSTWGLRYALSQLVPLRVHTTFPVESAEDRRGGRQQQVSLIYSPVVE